MALVGDGFIFVHVPKTGGRWVRRVTRALDIETFESGPPRPLVKRVDEIHCSIYEVPPEVRAGRLMFGCIRHPVSWLKSRWAKNRNYTGPHTHWIHKLLPCGLNTFLKRVIDAGRADAPSHMMLKRLGWVVEDGELIDRYEITRRRIGRTESIASDYSRFLRAAGVQFDEKALRQFPVQGAGGTLLDDAPDPELVADICEANKTLCALGGYEA